MTDADLDKLEAMANRCTSGDPWYKEGDLCGRQTFDQFIPQDRAFIAAASPATILDLIASARRDAEEIERLMAALKPFHAAYIALVETHCSFEVTGATAAERRFSDGEREDAAKEAAFEALTSITFDQLAAVDAALTARAAHTGEG